jgi:hypothetical protein
MEGNVIQLIIELTAAAAVLSIAGAVHSQLRNHPRRRIEARIRRR